MSMTLALKQREADGRLAAFGFLDSGNVRHDSDMATPTISRGRTVLTCSRSKNAQLQRELSHLSPELTLARSV